MKGSLHPVRIYVIPDGNQKHRLSNGSVRYYKKRRPMGFDEKLFAPITAQVTTFCLADCGANTASVSLPNSLDLGVGKSVNTAITFAIDQKGANLDKRAEAAGKLELVWTFSDESVATMDFGVVTAVGGTPCCFHPLKFCLQCLHQETMWRILPPRFLYPLHSFAASDVPSAALETGKISKEAYPTRTAF